MEVKIKKLDPKAVIPVKAHPTDAGFDLTSISKTLDDKFIEYDTGLAFEIPEGFVGLVFPRSSNGKKDLLLCNGVAVIDSHYRGPVKLRFRRQLNIDRFGRGINYPEALYDVGDKVGQIMIMPYPEVTFIESDILSETDRGGGGFGSSGK